MEGLSLQKDSAGLPFYVTEASTKSFSLYRWWRSLSPQKLIVLFMTALILVFLYQRSQSMAQVLLSEKTTFQPPVEDDLMPMKAVKAKTKRAILTFKGAQNERQRAVVGAFQHAWKGYKKYAWGQDQLQPVSQSYSNWFDTGLTIVDSLDTAIIMGLEKEVAEGTEWIEKELNFEKDGYSSLFEITIRILGGLLSSFHLTGNEMFVTKTTDLGDRLLAAFNTSSGIPLSNVNLQTSTAIGGSGSSLAEVATLQLEFRDLSRVTGNSAYEEIAFKVSQHIHEVGCRDDGLCEMSIDPSTGKFDSSTTITFGARSDSYYEYLLKQWLQTGKTIDWLRSDYEQAMESMAQKLLRHSEPNKLTFVGELLGGTSFFPKMDHLTCFIAGTLALGTENGLPQKHLEYAKGIGKTCHAMYENPTGLGPETVRFNMESGIEDLSINTVDSLLRPEAIEAWFYLYRITGDKMYQEWGWKAFEAIEKYARLPTGYATVNSVQEIPTTHRDPMESFYLAETLKYLYLLFAEDSSELPLDEWVFNTEAHPLPIRIN